MYRPPCTNTADSVGNGTGAYTKKTEKTYPATPKNKSPTNLATDFLYVLYFRLATACSRFLDMFGPFCRSLRNVGKVCDCHVLFVCFDVC